METSKIVDEENMAILKPSGMTGQGVGRLLASLVLSVALLPGAWAQNLTLFAAASLKEALDEAVNRYQKDKGSGDKIAISYAASSALARQIENGALADLFISADLDWMDYVEKRNLLRAGSRVSLLRNEIVLIAPSSSKAMLELKPGAPMAQVLGKERLSMADPDFVPAGKYGKAALEKLGLWASVADRVARAENVRAALLFVSRGEAPLGIVYRTDAAADKNVRIVATFPADSHPPIIYPAALLAGGKSAEAPSFFNFIKSQAAIEIFRKHGFVPY